MELRTPESFLDEVYEQKKALKELYILEIQKGYEQVLEKIESLNRPQECSGCYADPDVCPFMGVVGNEDCMSRRESYAKQKGDVSEAG